MLLAALISTGFDAILPALTACGALSAAIFTALRFNRDDATAIVNQHKEVLAGMKSLNDELQDALERAKADLAASRERERTLDAQLAAALNERVGTTAPRKARR